MLLHATYQRRPDRFWEATISEASTVTGVGTTLDQAEENLRTAIGRWLTERGEEGAAFHLRHQVTVDDETDQLVYAARSMHEQVEQRTIAAAASRLVQEAGISLRDAGRMLGLSHTRVAQVAGGTGSDRIRFECTSCGEEFPHSISGQLTASGSFRQVPTLARCPRCGEEDEYTGRQIRWLDSEEI